MFVLSKIVATPIQPTIVTKYVSAFWIPGSCFAQGPKEETFCPGEIDGTEAPPTQALARHTPMITVTVKSDWRKLYVLEFMAVCQYFSLFDYDVICTAWVHAAWNIEPSAAVRTYDYSVASQGVGERHAFSIVVHDAPLNALSQMPAVKSFIKSYLPTLQKTCDGAFYYLPIRYHTL